MLQARHCRGTCEPGSAGYATPHAEELHIKHQHPAHRPTARLVHSPRASHTVAWVASPGEGARLVLRLAASA